MIIKQIFQAKFGYKMKTFTYLFSHMFKFVIIKSHKK